MFDERTKELYAIPGSVPMLSHMPLAARSIHVVRLLGDIVRIVMS